MLSALSYNIQRLYSQEVFYGEFTLFHPGELAKLFGVSKQLLLYYDKNDIFSPEFVDENGYRFYVLSQYFTLQIIISLRKLDVPLKEIKAYLKSKDINLLKKYIATSSRNIKSRLRNCCI